MFRTLILLTVVVGFAVAAPLELRVIDFGNGTVVRMTSEMVDEIAQSKIGFMDVTDNEVANELAEVPKVLGAIPSQPTHQDYVGALIPNMLGRHIGDTIANLSSYYTRYYTTKSSLEAVLWLKSQYEIAAAGRDDITIQLFEHSWTQPSLIVTVEGSGALSGETVILGGHIDSINMGAAGNAPGADDDASGSSTVLEVFRVLMGADFKPDRTVEFHAYSAEEVGLRGSQAIANQYKSEQRKVVSMMQLDMVCYPYPEVASEAEIGLITDYTSSELNVFIRKLITTYCAIGYKDSQCGYACSDHGSWTKAGFDAAFPFESVFEHDNPYIHSAQDTLARCVLSHAAEFGKLGLGYVVEMSMID